MKIQLLHADFSLLVQAGRSVDRMVWLANGCDRHIGGLTNRT